MKRACAKKAFEMIKDGMAVGLGGGATVALLIGELAKSGRQVTAATPSGDTMELCRKNKIPVIPLEHLFSLDIAFDGCDEADLELNALKSRGGIHTREKLMASMAKRYVLLLDETKIAEKLAFCVPVAVEAIRPARAYVTKRLEEMGAAVAIRKGDGKTGYTISDDGNYLLDAVFGKGCDPVRLSGELDKMAGVVGHSLFCGIADSAIVAKSDGTVEIVERG